MKNIKYIFAILLFSGIFSQHRGPDIKYLIDNDVSIQLLLLAFEKYEKECYNDSTLYIEPITEVEILPDSNNVIDLTMSMLSYAIYKPRKVWRHRQPTLIGFIEYLRGRVE